MKSSGLEAKRSAVEERLRDQEYTVKGVCSHFLPKRKTVFVRRRNVFDQIGKEIPDEQKAAFCLGSSTIVVLI
jgi:hypothetical protein